ncbi:hypothetical protein [Limosilactobacillus galli]|uniref:hypothetical protein n=1 Tax=Limosilactobacillus galli TaxID=2991834 RepID=UPI0024BA167D|nr:hypothetical protein [Limosilactobacillus galli]
MEDHSLKLLGGVTDKRCTHVTGPALTMRVSGFLLFGGVTIRELPQAAASPVS